EPDDLAALDLDRRHEGHEHRLVVVGMVDDLEVLARRGVDGLALRCRRRAQPDRGGAERGERDRRPDDLQGLHGFLSFGGLDGAQAGSRPCLRMTGAAEGAVRNLTSARATSACFAPAWMPVENTVMRCTSA